MVPTGSAAASSGVVAAVSVVQERALCESSVADPDPHGSAPFLLIQIWIHILVAVPDADPDHLNVFRLVPYTKIFQQKITERFWMPQTCSLGIFFYQRKS